MEVLVLEDDEERIRGFRRRLRKHTVRCIGTAKDAIKLLSQKKFDYLFLDHDLGLKNNALAEGNTGCEVAKWLKENPSHKPAVIIIHSLNAQGRQNIKACLPEAIELPLAWQFVNLKSFSPQKA
jgi:CheY-like chemotaxis protein